MLIFAYILSQSFWRGEEREVSFIRAWLKSIYWFFAFFLIMFIYVNLCVYFIAKLLKLQNTRSFIFLKLPKHQQVDELMKRSVVHNIFIAKFLKMWRTRSSIFFKMLFLIIYLCLIKINLLILCFLSYNVYLC